MNTGATLEHLTEKDPATGEYKIPKIIYSDAYFSEMVPYADLILPDTTYLERWDCISMLDRPISEPDAPADAIRQPVVAPDRDVRPFQEVLIDLGARLKLPGFVEGGRLAEVSGRLSRLHRQPRAQARHRPAGRLPRQERRLVGQGRAQRASARPLHRRRLLPRAPPAAQSALLQARQPRLHRLGGRPGPAPDAHADDLPALQRADAEDAAGRARARRRAAARAASPPHRDVFRSAAVLVRAVRRGRDGPERVPDPRHHAAADGHVPLVGIAERLAAADPRLQQAVHQSRAGRAAGHRRRRLGVDHQPHRPGARAGQADGGRQRRHGVDLERHRQARRRLGARHRRAGGQPRLPAQPPDRRAAARAGRRLPLFQQRSDHGPGRLVRPQGAHRARARPGGGPDRAALRGAGEPDGRRAPRNSSPTSGAELSNGGARR